MKHSIDRVLFSLVSCTFAGILMKFLYSTWLYDLYIKQIAAIGQGIVLLDWIR